MPAAGLLIGVSLFISGKVCGTYGIALSSLGMLAFVGATVSIDAFGPIADNAGGLAESCHLDESVRAITDKLDAVGNTTAAIGKGFAIGSAAFATVSLIVAYVGNYTAINAEPVLNMASYIVVAGGIIGGALIVCGGVAQIFFSTAAASKQGEKIEKEEEIRENLEARLDQEQEREALS